MTRSVIMDMRDRLEMGQSLSRVDFLTDFLTLRILQNKSVKTHNIELYRTYSTLPIHLLHNYQLLVFTYS